MYELTDHIFRQNPAHDSFPDWTTSNQNEEYPRPYPLPIRSVLVGVGGCGCTSLFKI